MAWTAPKTYVAGNVLTAAEKNTYERDNMLFLHGRDVFFLLPGMEGIIGGETGFCGIHVATAGFTGDEDNIKFPAPVGFTANRLDAKSNAAPGGGESFAIQLRKDKIATDMTPTISGSSQEAGDTGSETYLEGDDISCRVIASGGAATSNIYLAIRCVPTG